MAIRLPITTTMGHVSRAILFQQMPYIYFGLGRTSPWEGETYAAEHGGLNEDGSEFSAPLPSVETTELDELIGFLRVLGSSGYRQHRGAHEHVLIGIDGSVRLREIRETDLEVMGIVLLVLHVTDQPCAADDHRALAAEEEAVGHRLDRLDLGIRRLDACFIKGCTVFKSLYETFRIDIAGTVFIVERSELCGRV